MALTKTTNRLERIIAVTAGLQATGAILGACCGAVVATVIAAVEAKSTFLLSAEFFHFLWMVALFGAVTGIFGAPALAWGLLRRVPLGRAILVTAIGTITGSILGEVLYPIQSWKPSTHTIPGVIVCGWLGFFFAGLTLRLLNRRA